jgi:hypothetical protein
MTDNIIVLLEGVAWYAMLRSFGSVVGHCRRAQRLRVSFFSRAAIVDIIFSFLSLSLSSFGFACVETPKVVSVGFYIKIAG